METPLDFNSELLLEIVRMKMPFGKYKGTLLSDLPDSYFAYSGNNLPPSLKVSSRRFWKLIYHTNDECSRYNF